MSLDYYTRVLGFKVDWQEDGFAGVSRERGHLMLCEGAQGQLGTWVWMGVEDAAAMYNELVTAGALIRHAPQNYPWALEFKVNDPDGHVLRIGSDSLDGVPFDDFTM